MMTDDASIKTQRTWEGEGFATIEAICPDLGIVLGDIIHSSRPRHLPSVSQGSAVQEYQGLWQRSI